MKTFLHFCKTMSTSDKNTDIESALGQPATHECSLHDYVPPWCHTGVICLHSDLRCFSALTSVCCGTFAFGKACKLFGKIIFFFKANKP